jgi:rubrerythrin
MPKEKIMEANEAFDVFTQIEKMMSECYMEISKLCNDESISKELAELSREEIDHMNLLKWGKDHLDGAQNTVVCIFERPAELSLVQDKIGRLINDIQEKKTGLMEAINDVAVLERIIGQLYLRRIAEVKNISLKRLFDLLSLGGREHNKSLFRIMQGLNSSNSPAPSTTDSARSNFLEDFNNKTLFGKKNAYPKYAQVTATRKTIPGKYSH